LGCQQVGIGNLIDLSRHAGWQLAAQVECRKRPGGLFMKGRKPLSHVRPSQIWLQTIAKFVTYLSMSQIRVYNHIKRLYCFKKFIAVQKLLWLNGAFYSKSYY